VCRRGWSALGQPNLATWSAKGVGDFNGDGADDILWQHQTNGSVGTWLVKNAKYNGWYGLGQTNAAIWTVKGVGDFNGDGTDDILWHSQTNGTVGTWLVKNASYNGWTSFGYADPAAWSVTGTGRFNADSVSDVLLQNASIGTVRSWFVKNAANIGSADLGSPNPLTWNLAGTQIKKLVVSGMLAAGGAADASAETGSLTEAELTPIVEQAIARWIQAGLDASMAAKLRSVQFVVGDLAGAALGYASEEANRVYLDINAAGRGWYVDATPATDEEYAGVEGGLRAVDSRAVDRIDLLTVVEHELGHILGFDDLDALAENQLMNGTLGVGARVNPYLKSVDLALASA